MRVFVYFDKVRGAESGKPDSYRKSVALDGGVGPSPGWVRGTATVFLDRVRGRKPARARAERIMFEIQCIAGAR